MIVHVYTVLQQALSCLVHSSDDDAWWLHTWWGIQCSPKKDNFKTYYSASYYFCHFLLPLLSSVSPTLSNWESFLTYKNNGHHWRNEGPNKMSSVVEPTTVEKMMTWYVALLLSFSNWSYLRPKVPTSINIKEVVPSIDSESNWNNNCQVQCWNTWRDGVIAEKSWKKRMIGGNVGKWERWRMEVPLKIAVSNVHSIARTNHSWPQWMPPGSEQCK